MECKLYGGAKRETYEIIGRYAMDASIIKMLGNPITTDENTQWVVGYENRKVIGFCKINATSNRNKISSVVVFEPRTGSTAGEIFKQLIEFASQQVDKRLPTVSYANAQTLPWFLELGFVMQKEGKEWHTVERKI